MRDWLLARDWSRIGDNVLHGVTTASIIAIAGLFYTAWIDSREDARLREEIRAEIRFRLAGAERALQGSAPDAALAVRVINGQGSDFALYGQYHGTSLLALVTQLRELGDSAIDAELIGAARALTLAGEAPAPHIEKLQDAIPPADWESVPTVPTAGRTGRSSGLLLVFVLVLIVLALHRPRTASRR